MKLPRALIAALIAGSGAACIGPRAPRSSVPYAVRLLGAEDGALRGMVRDGRGVFIGDTGRDFAIEVTNATRSDVGLSIVIDGLDATTGAPVTSCERLGGWIVPAEGTTIARGFAVSATQQADKGREVAPQKLAVPAPGPDPPRMGAARIQEPTAPRTPERRRHRVYVTRNTEYHFRDGFCVAVRDRRTGDFLQGHLAVQRRLHGGLKFFGNGAIVPNSGEPQPGEALYFAADGRDLVTSPVERVDRPAKSLVQAYPEVPQPPKARRERSR